MMAREIIAAVCFILAALIYICVVIGTNKFKYVLNRMHAAAMGDTLGILLVVIGSVVYFGFTFASLKAILVLAFLWFSSPVSSHLIAKLEFTTHPEHRDAEYRVVELTELEKEYEEKENVK